MTSTLEHYRAVFNKLLEEPAVCLTADYGFKVDHDNIEFFDIGVSGQWGARIPIVMVSKSESMVVRIIPHYDGLTMLVRYEARSAYETNVSNVSFWKPNDGLLQIIAADQVGTGAEWVFGMLVAAYVAWLRWHGYDDADNMPRLRVRSSEDTVHAEWAV